MLKLHLQLFSDNLNKTTSPDLAVEMQTYYSDYLIDIAGPKLVHEQFGDKYPIPKNQGKTVQLRKYKPLDKATDPITEGVTPAGNKLTVEAVTGEIMQYGDFIQMTDMLQLTALDNNVVQATKLLGAQAGRTLDTITREILNTGTNVYYAGGKTSRAALDQNCKVSVDLIYQVATKLKTNNADPVDDCYVAIIHPHAAYDLMKDERWIDAHKYVNPKNIYTGELGKIGGVRFVESSDAKIWTGTGCPSGLAVYSTLVFGAHAYGVTEVTGGGLQHIVKQLGYGDDPLNQRSSCGWKATRAVELLVDEYMIRIESCSSYSDSAASN
jgi:N4-gp56 family major capsid protein